MCFWWRWRCDVHVAHTHTETLQDATVVRSVATAPPLFWVQGEKWKKTDDTIKTQHGRSQAASLLPSSFIKTVMQKGTLVWTSRIIAYYLWHTAECSWRSETRDGGGFRPCQTSLVWHGGVRKEWELKRGRGTEERNLQNKSDTDSKSRSRERNNNNKKTFSAAHILQPWQQLMAKCASANISAESASMQHFLMWLWAGLSKRMSENYSLGFSAVVCRLFNVSEVVWHMHWVTFARVERLYQTRAASKLIIRKISSLFSCKSWSYFSKTRGKYKNLELCITRPL